MEWSFLYGKHKRLPWHATEPEAIYKALHTSEEGLSDAEAAERLAASGAMNCVRNRKKPSGR